MEINRCLVQLKITTLGSEIGVILRSESGEVKALGRVSDGGEKAS